jgi:hypothetical protein
VSELLALDAGWRQVRTAEHDTAAVVAALGVPPLLACTHLVPDPSPRAVVTIELPPAVGGRAELLRGALAQRTGNEDVVVVAAGAETGRLASTTGDNTGAGLVAPLTAHAHRLSGRAFRFPGADALVGVLAVQDVVARSAVDRVEGIAGRTPPPDALLDTQSWVRPELVGGSLVLLTRPGTGGRLVPFEQPHATPCCEDH